MSKLRRHAKILEILDNDRIFTQEQLLERLCAQGFDVTQSTVSRDIRELHLVKVLGDDGSYAYAGTKPRGNGGGAFRFHAIFSEAVSTIDYAQNLIVVKCHTGMANAACAALDTVEWNGVVGTVAGDDTILVIMRDNDAAAALADELYRLLGKKSD